MALSEEEFNWASSALCYLQNLTMTDYFPSLSDPAIKDDPNLEDLYKYIPEFGEVRNQLVNGLITSIEDFRNILEVILRYYWYQNLFLRNLSTNIPQIINLIEEEYEKTLVLGSYYVSLQKVLNAVIYNFSALTYDIDHQDRNRFMCKLYHLKCLLGKCYILFKFYNKEKDKLDFYTSQIYQINKQYRLDLGFHKPVEEFNEWKKQKMLNFSNAIKFDKKQHSCNNLRFTDAKQKSIILLSDCLLTIDEKSIATCFKLFKAIDKSMQSFFVNFIQYTFLIRPLRTRCLLRLLACILKEGFPFSQIIPYYKVHLIFNKTHVNTIKKNQIYEEDLGYIEQIDIYPSDSIEYLIAHDSLTSLESNVSFLNCIKENKKPRPCTIQFLNIHLSQFQNYMELMAFFNAKDCFNFALQRSVCIPAKVALYAAAGNSEEILFKICGLHDIDYETAITVAIQYHSYSAFDLLLSLVKSANIQFSSIPRCLNNRIALYILNDSAFTERFINYDNGKALLVAAATCNTALFHILVAKGFRTTVVGQNGETILHLAAQYGSKSIVQSIIDSPIKMSCFQDVNIKDNQNRTPLYLASQHNQLEVVKLLIAKKADPFIKSIKDMDAISIAIRELNINVVEFFLARKLITMEQYSKYLYRVLLGPTQALYRIILRQKKMRTEQNFDREDVPLESSDEEDEEGEEIPIKDKLLLPVISSGKTKEVKKENRKLMCAGGHFFIIESCLRKDHVRKKNTADDYWETAVDEVISLFHYVDAVPTHLEDIVNIPRTTLIGWFNNVQKEKDWSPLSKKLVGASRAMKPALEYAIFYYIYTKYLNKGRKFTDSMLSLVALEFWRQNKNLRGKGEFKASIRWVRRFKKIFHIVTRKVHMKRRTEVTEENLQKAKNYFIEVAQLVKDYDKEKFKILNVDETFWRLFDNGSLTWARKGTEGVTCICDWDDKEGITALATVSLDAEKYPLNLIREGKSKRSLDALTELRKYFQMDVTENGWSTQYSFSKYLLWLRIEFNARHPNSANDEIHLILDIHSSHRGDIINQVAADNHIVLHYIPASYTDLLQPLDRYIFGPLKNIARHIWNTKYLLNPDAPKTMLDACNVLHSAWNQISDDLITKAWDVYSHKVEKTFEGVLATTCQFPLPLPEPEATIDEIEWRNHVEEETGIKSSVENREMMENINLSLFSKFTFNDFMLEQMNFYTNNERYMRKQCAAYCPEQKDADAVEAAIKAAKKAKDKEALERIVKYNNVPNSIFMPVQSSNKKRLEGIISNLVKVLPGLLRSNNTIVPSQRRIQVMKSLDYCATGNLDQYNNLFSYSDNITDIVQDIFKENDWEDAVHFIKKSNLTLDKIMNSKLIKEMAIDKPICFIKEKDTEYAFPETFIFKDFLLILKVLVFKSGTEISLDVMDGFSKVYYKVRYGLITRNERIDNIAKRKGNLIGIYIPVQMSGDEEEPPFIDEELKTSDKFKKVLSEIVNGETKGTIRTWNVKKGDEKVTKKEGKNMKAVLLYKALYFEYKGIELKKKAIKHQSKDDEIDNI